VLGHTATGKLRLKADGHREFSTYWHFPRHLPGQFYVERKR
jgi:hypothetical protein